MTLHTLVRSRYSADLLARVAAGWRRLGDDERRGVVAAACVAADLAALDAPRALLALAAHVVRDEVHHVDVCTRVLEAIDPGGARGPAFDVALADPESMDVRETTLARTLVTELALGKPQAAAAFAAARAQVREPLFAWAYTELMRDEARHATFGAKAAAWVVRRWSDRQRQSLWTTCLTTGVTPSAPPIRDAEAEALGLLPAEADSTLPLWILPHLTPLGRSSTANSHLQ